MIVIVCPWPLIPVVVPRPQWKAVQIRAGFPLFVVMNSMVDCNEMNIAHEHTCSTHPFYTTCKNLSNNQNFNLQHPENGNWCN